MASGSSKGGKGGKGGRGKKASPAKQRSNVKKLVEKLRKGRTAHPDDFSNGKVETFYDERTMEIILDIKHRWERHVRRYYPNETTWR